MNKTNAPDRNRTCNPRLRRSVLYPVELRALMPIRAKALLVGAVGFELTTLCSQSRCANRAALRPDEKKRTIQKALFCVKRPYYVFYQTDHTVLF